MSIERLVASLERLEQALAAPSAPALDWDLEAEPTLELLESMLLARHLDLMAQRLREEGVGHYTIASAGHEANVVLGRLTRATDPTMLHYRSAAVQLERARAHPEVDAVRDIALSLVASSEDPLCSGRHKVFGSRTLGIIPQTSTIGSHLPRAVGLAFAIERKLHSKADFEGCVQIRDDSIAMVSFGDASLNHSTSQGALNTASWVVQQRLKLPLLFVCEDNGLGISVQSPEGFVTQRLASQPLVPVFSARGWHLDEAHRVASEAIAHCRQTRRPAILHLRCERLLGHAGSDVDTTYRSPADIRTAEERDPLLRAAVDAVASGVIHAEQVRTLMRTTQHRVHAAADRARGSSRLETRAAIRAPLVCPKPRPSPGFVEARNETSTLARGLNHGLDALMRNIPQTLVFGEDVAKKGGVYGITRGLLAKHGPARVFNTLLDEQSILGLGLGTATSGFLPIPEIQYLAYLHNAEDQLRGEAATLPFFSNGQFDNPMVVRIAGLGYQRGFGGHFHNDNSLAVLRDVPGLVLGIPTRADDACSMLEQAATLALECRRVVVLVEPIALYHQRDLYEPGDDGWLSPLAPTGPEFGRARVYGEEAKDLLIITYGNGVRLSLRAARALAEQHGIRARVLDLRWLEPLPMEDLRTHLDEVGRALIVDECRTSGSPSEGILARLVDEGRSARVRRVTSDDCYIPLGEAAHRVLLSEEDIVEAALEVPE